MKNLIYSILISSTAIINLSAHDIWLEFDDKKDEVKLYFGEFEDKHLESGEKFSKIKEGILYPSELLKEVKEKKHPEWMEQVKEWKNKYPLQYTKKENEIKAQQAIEAISRITKGEAVVITDVGQHQMWTAQYYKFNKAGNFCSSGGAGTMGFGVPAGMGAQIGRPNDIVVSIVGDGGFQMTSQELMTIMQYKLPVKTIILNNEFLGMVRQWQEIFHSKRYSSVDLSINPDFIKLADAYGMNAVKIEDPNKLDEELTKHLLSKEPVLIEIKITKEANVFPMIPAGTSIHQLVGEKGEL